MFRYIYSTLLFLIFSLNLLGQTAQEWLDQVKSVYTKAPTYYIKFEVSQTGQAETDIGEVFAAKEKYNLNVMGINQIYDGKSLFTISKEDKEVTISIPGKDSDDLLTPVKILNMYSSGYDLSLDKRSTVDGQNIQFIKLTPTNAQSNTKQILVGVNTNNKTLYQFQETFKDGNSRTITVKDFLENLIIPRALFKFEKTKYENNGYIVTQI